MLHEDRLYGVAWSPSPESIAKRIDDAYAFTCCTGFGYRQTFEDELREVVLLNDSFSEDSAQEYAVLLRSTRDNIWRQVETLTVSWMDADGIAETVRGLLEADPPGYAIFPRIEGGDTHTCDLCR